MGESESSRRSIMKKSLYEITDDIKAIWDLMNSLEDEDANPREPTEDEMKILAEFFNVSEKEFKMKFDSYCKFIKNLKMQAEIAKAEKNAYKTELDRLSKRATAHENRAKRIQGYLWECMQKLGLAKDGFKTALFSAKEQNTQISIEIYTGADLSKVPEEFLKPRELNKQAIKDAIKDGTLIKKEKNGRHWLAFFGKEDEELEGVYWAQGRALYIR